MVCAPVRKDNPRALAMGLSTVQVHKPCSISHLFILPHFFYFGHSNTSHNDRFRTSFGVFRNGAKVTSLLKFRVLMSRLTSRVSCLSPSARQNFPAPLKYNKLCLIGKKSLPSTRSMELSFLLQL